MTEEKQMPNVGIYPTNNGIAFDLTDENGERKVVYLHPEDAGRIAVTLITTIAVMKVQEMMVKAQEAMETQRILEQVKSGGLPIK